jgi:sRNA-binding regulator protein Hfq
VGLANFEQERQRKVLQKVFLVAIAWAFGGALEHTNHVSFEMNLTNGFSSMQDLPKTSIFDNTLVVKEDKSMLLFKHWSTFLSESSSIASAASHETIFVETIDTLRFKYWISLLLSNGRPVLLTG